MVQEGMWVEGQAVGQQREGHKVLQAGADYRVPQQGNQGEQVLKGEQ